MNLKLISVLMALFIMYEPFSFAQRVVAVNRQEPTYYCKTHDPHFAGPVSCAPPLKNYNHWFFPPVLYSQYAHPEYFMEYPWYGYGPRYGGAYW